MTPAAPRRFRRLLLASLAVLLCATALVGGVVEPASAAPKPAKVKGVKLKQPRVDGTKASFKVKWKRAARATSYKVKWKVPGGNAHKQKTSKTNLVIDNLAQARDYCVKVRAFNGKRKGKWSKQVCRTTARIDPVQPVWVDRQWVEGATVAVNFRWNEVPGATKYELAYLQHATNDIQKSKNTRVVSTPATGTGTASVPVGGLVPGKPYCFQVRASGPLGTGPWGVAGCKQTTPLGRTGGPLHLNVVTWNLCANACADWSVREPLIKTRIADQIKPDAVAIQEGPNVSYDNMDPLPGYVRACKVGDGLGTNARNQTLFVSERFELTGAPNGVRFPNVTHGGCWVRVKDTTTERELVLTSVHLVNPANPVGSDATRGDEMAEFMAAIAADPTTAGLPVVIAGDLNSTRNSRRDAPREVLNFYGYDDAFDIAESYNTLPYVNSFNGWANPAPISLRWGAHVDRVFVPPGARATSWQMDSVLAGGTGRQLSDHSPVRVTVELP